MDQVAAWIKSITTLAGAHDGSTLHTKLGDQVTEVIKDFIIGLFAILPGQIDEIYDMDLDHFELEHLPGEPFRTYVTRMLDSPIFDPDFKDTAEYDLSP